MLARLSISREKKPCNVGLQKEGERRRQERRVGGGGRERGCGSGEGRRSRRSSVPSGGVPVISQVGP